MDRRVWQEQVEATLDGGDRAFLPDLARFAPPPGPPDLELVRVRLLAALGQGEAAAAALPDLAAVEDQPALHRAWAAAAVDLACAGVLPNHWGLGRALTRLAEAAVQRGDAADALDILERHVAAALARGATPVAARGLELLGEVVDPSDPQAPRLSKRRRKAAEAAIAALRTQVEAAPAPAPALPPDPAQVHGGLSGDPERDLVVLQAAAARWPGRADLLHALAHAWGALDDPSAGTDAFARAVAARPADLELATAFGWHLARTGQLATLDAWVEERFLGRKDPLTQARGHYLLAHARMERGAVGAARSSVERMLALQPDSAPGRHLLARTLRADGHLEDALELLEALADEAPTGPWAWDRMEVATRLGRWASVRSGAQALGMPVTPGEGPVDERWSPCRLVLPGAEGQRPLPAIRTGPVTARIVELAAPGMRQRYGEIWLLRAEALEPVGPHLPLPPEGPLFAALERLEASRVQVRAFDGFSPGEEALRAFGHRLHALGAPLQWWDLAEPDAQGHRLHLRVGLPAGGDLAAIEAVLAELRVALGA